MLPIFALLELAAIILFVWFILTQVVFPVVLGVPLFPWFRRRQLKKLMAEISDAEARKRELNLRATRLRQESELLLAEAKLRADAALQQDDPHPTTDGTTVQGEKT